MSNHQRISGIFVLAVLANTTAVHAQGPGRFNRVSTASSQRSSASSSLSRLTNVARTGAIRGVERTAAGADSLHPFSNQATAEMQAGTSGVPRFSTQQESQPVEAPRVAQPQSRTYYPGMRAARAIQQPVRLTARATGIPPHICTPSRSMMMGGGHR